MHVPIIACVIAVILVAAFNYYLWRYYTDIYK